MERLEELRKVTGETIGGQFYIAPNETNWTIYFAATRTNFKGTLEEVIQAGYEEIISYRLPISEHKHYNKNLRHKKYIYKL